MPATTEEKPYGLPYWLDFERPTFPMLDRDLTADAAIIGSGVCGVKIARWLARHGFRVVVLEGTRVGDGASGRNQGSINHGAAIGYGEAIRRYGREMARQIWQLGLENHRRIREQIAEYTLDCCYQNLGYTYLARRDMDDWEASLAHYREDCRWLREDGFAVALIDEKDAIRLTRNPLFAGGFRYLSDAQFHAGRYVAGLAQAVARQPKVSLYEHTRVLKMEKEGDAVRLATPKGIVSAARVFIATNALIPQFIPSLERAMRAERGQVFVTESLAERPCMGSFATAMAWWREIPEANGRYRLLFGGGRKRDDPDSLFPQFRADGRPHPKLESEGFSPSPEHQKRLEVQFARIFPHLSGIRMVYRWGGLQSFTADDFPIVGALDAEGHIYGAGAFCGRGNCYSDVAAEYVAGKAFGIVSDVAQRFGHLFEQLMAVDRPSARWGEWRTAHL